MWRIGIAFLLGQCCVHTLAELPPVWPWSLALVVVCSIAARARWWLLLAVLLGFGWTWVHAHMRLADDLPPALEGEDVVISGDVASIVDAQGVDAQFEFAVRHASVARMPQRVRLAWYDTDALPRPGETWRFVVRLKRRNGFANPGSFDYEGHLFRERIGATGYVRADDRNRKLAEPGWRYGVLCARAFMGERIQRAVGNSPMLGVLQGLAVGDTHAMTSEQWRVFAATGTTHLMAISGLHISMLASLAALCGRRIVWLPFAQRLRITAIAGEALAGSLASVAYALLAGMSVPTQRTLIMLCTFFVARWARRALSIGSALGLALLAILIVDPFAGQTVGAWLSFGAVAVILLAMNGRIGFDRAWTAFARVQWAVTLGLVPLLVIAFGSVSLVAPISNAFAVPLFSFVLVPLVLLGTALASFAVPVGRPLLEAAAQILEWCWPWLDALAELPLAQWHLPAMTFAHYASLAAGMLLLILPSSLPVRAVAVLLCVPPLLFRPAGPAAGAVELAVLDVGQGLAVIVRTRTHTLVYDTGPAFRSGRDAGEWVVLPYLHSLGVRRIDRLVISHGDLDHQGGMRSVLDGMPTRSLWIGPSVQAPGIPSAICAQGRAWTWDRVRFEVLHPGPNAAASDNDTSCVLRIETATGSVLLTGDIEAKAEAALVAGGIGHASVVLIAHHGSRTSSSDAFVSATRPEVAIVSAGYRNRWGFPKADVVDRWRTNGARVFSTIDGGALRIAVGAEPGIRVGQYRDERRRYWSSR